MLVDVIIVEINLSVKYVIVIELEVAYLHKNLDDAMLLNY